MALDDLKRLDAIDLSQVTAADVKQLKNEPLKRSLLDALRSKAAVDSHQQHISHHDHSTSPEKPPVLEPLPP